MTTLLTAPTYTWTCDVNNAAAAGASTYIQAQNTIHEVKTALVNIGWTLQSSSNSSSAGASDYLTASTNWVWSTGAHAWARLRDPDLSNFEIVIDCNRASVNPHTMDIYFSPSGGFSGGSTTARPTASDEQSIIVNSNWISSASATATVVHATRSAGVGTRLWIYRGGGLVSWWQFDLLRTQISGQSNGVVARVHGSVNAANDTELASAQNAFAVMGSTKVSMYYAIPAQASVSTYWSDRTTDLADANELESTTIYPAHPLIWVGNTASYYGSHAIADDLYIVSTGLSDGDDAPSTGLTKKWVVVGNLLVPWDGASTMSTV